MVFGVYFLTTLKEGAMGEGRVFGDFDDVMLAYDSRNQVDIQAKVVVRVRPEDANCEEGGRKLFRVREGKSETVDIDVTDGPKRFETTVGRIIFNRQCLPADYPFMNYKMSKGDISALVNDCCDRYSTADVEPILDAIKETGFHYATVAGLDGLGLGCRHPAREARDARRGAGQGRRDQRVLRGRLPLREGAPR
ncbi:MAG: hypothetical protein LKE76_01905 [Atopobiaceae bacterium]|jgi:DNA-directed RNA polymerase subunit beta'|nr:hypothetical protein [Atopobiaceae bacterium]